MKSIRARFRLLVVLLATVALTPAVALAHGQLKSSEPADSSHLSAAPTELRLTFTEAVELTFTRVGLFGPDGKAVVLSPLAFGDGDAHRVVVAAIRGHLVDGTYTVAWQMAGADGHPVRGRFSFMVMSGASGLADTTAALASGAAGTGLATALPGKPAIAGNAPGQTPPLDAHRELASMQDDAGFDAESPLYVAIRWMTFTAILVALGAAAFHLFVLGFLRRARGPDSTMLVTASARAAILGYWAAMALGVAALLRLYAQSYALQGGADSLDPGLIGSMLARTVWGWGWLLQATGVSIAAAGFHMARRNARPGSFAGGWGLAILGTVALAFTPALSGHAAAVPRLMPLAVLTDAAHVIGAGGWLGSLLMVVAVGIPLALRLPDSDRGRAAADLVNAFSPTALVFAGITAATGVFAAWLHLGTVGALWQTGYGKTLLLKLGVLSVVAGTGAYNWRRVKPSLGDVEGARRIRRSATAELAAGVVVLLITAVLVATPTGRESDMAARDGSNAPNVSSAAIARVPPAARMSAGTAK